MISTFQHYIAWQFIKHVCLVIGGLLSIVYIFDTLELMRRAAKSQAADFWLVLEMGLLKLPEVGQVMLPFAILFGAMMTLWQLSRRQELVIFRASGLSVWEFLGPMLMVAALFGIMHMAVINPVSSVFLTKYDELSERYLSSNKRVINVTREGLWLKEADREGEMILHSGKINLDTWHLTNVMALFFDQDGHNVQRIDADSAELAESQWIFQNAVVSRAGETSYSQPQLALTTDMTRDDIRDSFADPENISFWKLPEFIATLRLTGLDATQLRIHWHSLLSQPLYLAAMVLLAAVVALRPPRSRANLYFLVAGVMVGFTIYFFASFLKALGVSQQIPIILAAWAPALICTLCGLAILLQTEDG